MLQDPRDGKLRVWKKNKKHNFFEKFQQTVSGNSDAISAISSGSLSKELNVRITEQYPLNQKDIVVFLA